MSNPLSVPFKGTKEQEAKLREVIKKHKGENGAAIPVLHEAQDIYGYLPIEVQKIISEGLGVPLAEIYGIVTFYTQFSLYPKFEYDVRVCLCTACYVIFSGTIIEKIKERLGIDLGQCSAD
ncbi:MAG: NAD(P)H-dependent oxidoreductase subunit E, partial [Clostridia bacterium]|nr:NAD(P)H-dependent oxidoreductase subunit E [Clostridia bacterium]